MGNETTARSSFTLYKKINTYMPQATLKSPAEEFYQSRNVSKRRTVLTPTATPPPSPESLGDSIQFNSKNSTIKNRVSQLLHKQIRIVNATTANPRFA
jgi:hypothetical protein